MFLIKHSDKSFSLGPHIFARNSSAASQAHQRQRASAGGWWRRGRCRWSGCRRRRRNSTESGTFGIGTRSSRRASWNLKISNFSYYVRPNVIIGFESKTWCKVSSKSCFIRLIVLTTRWHLVRISNFIDSSANCILHLRLFVNWLRFNRAFFIRPFV